MTRGIDLGDLLDNVSPSLIIPQLPSSEVATDNGRDLFAEKSRSRWKGKGGACRCDHAPNRTRSRVAFGRYAVLSLWTKSTYGPTLDDIKTEPEFVERYADEVTAYIRQLLGYNLDKGDWSIITSPKRRHTVRNFATEVARLIARQLRITFVEDCATCKDRNRVVPVFYLNRMPPTRNVILFDDIITTGSTVRAMHDLLEPLELNIVTIVAISNKA